MGARKIWKRQPPIVREGLRALTASLNPTQANEYGIVMGTSHHEPMLCAQQEWKRYGTDRRVGESSRAGTDVGGYFRLNDSSSGRLCDEPPTRNV
jgi:Glycosyl hydrolase family 115